MNFKYLPNGIKEKILKLAKEYPITIEEAEKYYLMGGDHADILCQLKVIGEPEEFIMLQNNILWEKRMDKYRERFKTEYEVNWIK